MLGNEISDPSGVEGDIRKTPGLSLLDMETVLRSEKSTFTVEAKPATSGGTVIEGYEIHMGETLSKEKPFSTITCRNSSVVSIDDGGVSKDGAVFGTYIHGIFDNDLWRSELLNRAPGKKGHGPEERSLF